MVTGTRPLRAVRVIDWSLSTAELAELGVDGGTGVGEHRRLLGRPEVLGLAAQDEVTELAGRGLGAHRRRPRTR